MSRDLDFQFGVLVDDIDKASGGALTDASAWISKAAVDFLDSYVGKIVLATIAGIVTGGVGAAIVGPTLAALAFTLPAAALGEVKFVSAFIGVLDDYTKNPVLDSFPGASEAVGNDARRALTAITAERGKPAELAQAYAELNALYGPGRLYTVSPEEFSKMYAAKVREIQGPDWQTSESPQSLSKRLGVREDAAALAIGVWNGVLPDMSGYDPKSGKKISVSLQQGLSGNTARAVTQAIAMQSAKTGISSGVKTGIVAAEAAPPTTTAAKAAPTLAAQAALRQSAAAQLAAPVASGAAPSAGGFEARDAAPVVAGVAAGAVASVAAGLAIGPVIAIGAGVALLTRYALKR